MTNANPPYQLRLSPEALRSLDRLPQKIAAAIAEFMTAALINDPWRITKPLKGDLIGLSTARRGDYRILMRILDDGIIEVVCIAHRAHVYRPH